MAPVQAALAAHLDEQLAKLLQAELNELQVKGIRRPVAHSLWHAVQCELDFRVQRVCDLLRGVGLRVVRLDFVQGPVVARLGDLQPQRLSELIAIRDTDLKFMPDGLIKRIIRKSKSDHHMRCRRVFAPREMRSAPKNG